MDQDQIKVFKGEIELQSLIESIVNGVTSCEESATCGGCAACSSSCAHPASCVGYSEAH